MLNNEEIWSSRPDCYNNLCYKYKDLDIWIFGTDDKQTQFKLSYNKIYNDKLKIKLFNTLEDAKKYVEDLINL